MIPKFLALSGVLFLTSVSVCWSQNCPTGAVCTGCPGAYPVCKVTEQTSFPVFPSGAQYTRVIITDNNRGITSLPAGTFDGLKIADLRIHGTGIFELVCDTFRGLESTLTSLYLTNNSISTIAACAFKDLRKLRTLDLSDNHLSRLTVNSFPELPFLYQLWLRNNRLSLIEDGAINISRRLYRLDLRDNLLTSSLWTALNSSYFSGLRQLYLDRNPLESVSVDVLSLLPVEYFTVRSCSLKTFQWENLTPKRYFYQLDLSHNLIENFGTETSPVNLYFRGSIFNISSNSLRTLNINFTWSGSTYFTRKILAVDNKLTMVNFVVYPTGSETLSSITVDLRANNIDSPFNVSIKTDKVVNIDFTILLDNNRIKELKRFPMIVRRIEFGETSVWDTCKSSKSPANNIDVSRLSLRGNSLVNVKPDACLSVAKTLDLSVNNLTEFNLQSTALERRISTLNVSSNQIKDVCIDNMTLITVDLSHNLISTLPDFSSNLAQKRFHSLILSGNPLHCDCGIFWTRFGDFRDKIVGAVCKSPDEEMDTNLLSVDLSACSGDDIRSASISRCLQLIPPIPKENSKDDLILALVVVSGVLLLTTLVLVVVLCLLCQGSKCMLSRCLPKSHYGQSFGVSHDNKAYERPMRSNSAHEEMYESPN